MCLVLSLLILCSSLVQESFNSQRRVESAGGVGSGKSRSVQEADHSANDASRAGRRAVQLAVLAVGNGEGQLRIRGPQELGSDLLHELVDAEPLHAARVSTGHPSEVGCVGLFVDSQI
jgi:hypothetical protein